MKKFTISFIITSAIFVFMYFLLHLYDKNQYLLSRVMGNKLYIIFLFLSINTRLYLYEKNDKKSKNIKYGIIIVNILYLGFCFLSGGIGLTNIQCIIFLGITIIGFLTYFLKNRIGYSITIILLVIDLGIIFIGTIPLYNQGPNYSGFEDKYITKLITYSNDNINTELAYLQKDNKKYEIKNGINEFNFFVNKGSEISFKANDFYPNSYGFLLFKKGEFIEISPQSAIKISENNDIEILAGNIKYYPQNPTQFVIIGGNKGILEDNIQIINTITKLYNEKLKYYIKNNSKLKTQLNPTILKISKKTLNILSKFNSKYENNIKNMQEYLDIFDINL